MTAEARDPIPEIRRGKIYRDVYAKRSPDNPALGDAHLERARIADGALDFGDSGVRNRAFRDGVFLLEIPPELDVSAGDAFARQFYEGPAATPYGRFRDIGSDRFGDPLLGFHQRINQIEQFLLERRFWAADYPPEIAALGEALTRLSRQVLRSVLAEVGIPEEDWRRATGGCSQCAGSYHLTFNHYRPAHEDIGLSSHKDDGFLTILRTTAPGLEVSREDHWETVPAHPDCLIVNFGLSMEILTAGSRMPVAAIMHRVARQQEDRSSFGHFSSSGCLPGEDEGIHRYVRGRGLERVCGSRELIDENDYEIYAGTDAPVGAKGARR
ncbi:isopenicillin N synthase family oxygenase [Streptomyces kanamyceticus]|uniref:Isopenicillin N synthase family oxygenase n=1 Tax=Streptomyces kanamyceticus TaxID=1967 RepID=A0A5J6G8W3_STRKN|nr:isopenicillin N synthase family oxygenase [Streptomyces kanamyceticus]